MTMYTVSIDNRDYQVDLSGGKWVVDGEQVEVDLTPLNGLGLHLLRRAGQAVELFLAAHSDDTYELQVGSRRVVAKVQTIQSRQRAQAQAQKAGALKAPMPGLVVEVLVQPGETVEAGQTLLVLESMKMQMRLRSQVAGVVRSVEVERGSQVEKGALLVLVAGEQPCS